MVAVLRVAVLFALGLKIQVLHNATYRIKKIFV
jgi:hypothetical protein